MCSSQVKFIFLLICSYTFITPHWGGGRRKWLKKRFNKLDTQIKQIDSKTDRIDLNVQLIKDELEYALDERGFLILHIEIKNELSVGVSGDIIYEDNFHQKYKVSGFGKADVPPQDELIIKKVTGKTDGVDGVICVPYIHGEDDEPKRKFHIVPDDEGGCIVLPASEQYHHISPTHWYENEELVTQQDYFHPGTREAIMKTEAHGDNHATTMVFQGREATRSRRSTGFGLMVTAAGPECHVNEITDEIGVNPENILVPKVPVAKGPINSRNLGNNTKHTYVTNLITATEVIYPDDNRVKLTETMKKACEGKTIFYNSQHVVESGDTIRRGVFDGEDKMDSRYEKLVPKKPKTVKSNSRNACPANRKKNIFTSTTVANCGMWKYGGDVEITNGNVKPQEITIENNHLHTYWTVAAQCCEQSNTRFFPCEIIEGIENKASPEAERAFSTAFAVSSGKDLSEDGGPLCMGMSRFCQWDEDDEDTYKDWGFTAGACSAKCTSYCNNYQHDDFKAVNEDKSIEYPNGCFKCFGMYPGFFHHYAGVLDGHVQTEYGTCGHCAHVGSYKGPCTENNVCDKPEPVC